MFLIVFYNYFYVFNTLFSEYKEILLKLIQSFPAGIFLKFLITIKMFFVSLQTCFF